MLQLYTPESPVSDFVLANQTLLRSAHANWYDDELVTEEVVETVKGVVRQVFNLTGDLSGWRAEDALVFTQADSVWYIILLRDDSIHFMTEDVCVPKNARYPRDQSIRNILLFLAEGKEQDQEKALLSPPNKMLPLFTPDSPVSDFVLANQNLLRSAHINWYDDELVTEEDVETVKGVVRQVFNLTGDLSGWRAEDALVFTQPDDDSVWYAMLFKDDDILWTKAKVCMSKNVWFSRDQSLVAILTFLNTEDEEEEDPEKALLSDFFNYWRRHFSLDRIPRVTGRKDNSSKPIPRDADSLNKMQREASMLGFGATIVKDGELRISWEDPEEIEDGGVPIMGTVSGDSGEDRGYTRDPDDEFGFYIEEYYGPEPIFIKTWGDWDNYLKNCMWPSYDKTPFKNSLAKDLLEEVVPLCGSLAETIVDRMFETFDGELSPICSLVNARWDQKHGFYSRHSIRRMTFQMEAELIQLLVSTGVAVC
jgi:hypothetical protein